MSFGVGVSFGGLVEFWGLGCGLGVVVSFEFSEFGGWGEFAIW